MTLTARQLDVLDSMWGQRDRWVPPSYIGARDGSHHAATLRSLNRRGLVDRRKSCRRHGTITNGECRCKGSCRYRLSAAGLPVARPKEKR